MNPLSWVAGLAADRMLGLPGPPQPYTRRPDVPVPMPDGVVLLGDLYRPHGPARPLPVVLIRSPYGRAGVTGLVFAAPLARRGFQVFIQSIRGTFGSGGQLRAQRGADQILAVTVELDPTGYRLAAGHRIRLQVSGGAFPAFARNFGTGEPFATATRARRCAFEIHADAAHPSRVTPPVLRCPLASGGAGSRRLPSSLRSSVQAPTRPHRLARRTRPGSRG